jgi:hypothetical protein
VIPVSVFPLEINGRNGGERYQYQLLHLSQIGGMMDCDTGIGFSIGNQWQQWRKAIPVSAFAFESNWRNDGLRYWYRFFHWKSMAAMEESNISISFCI